LDGPCCSGGTGKAEAAKLPGAGIGVAKLDELVLNLSDLHLFSLRLHLFGSCLGVADDATGKDCYRCERDCKKL